MAFTARCILRSARSATLATQAGGQPFASLVTHAVAPDGSMLMLLSALSTHTGHLLAESRCALLATGPQEGPNPQTVPRLTVTGTAEQVGDPALRRFWVARHPYAALYADFTDFSVWRVVPQGGLYVGGFGLAANLTSSDLCPPEASVSSLAESEDRIIAHCNKDHADSLGRLARAQGEAGQWRMIGVDPDGFDLVQDDSVVRVAFDAPVADGADVRAALVRLLR